MQLLKKAFTMMEIMTVVIIIGVIAVFAIPNFTKTMESSYQQDAVTQLTAIHAAQEVYKAQNSGKYWPPDGSSYDLTAINSNLGLSIMANGMTYACTGTNGSTYSCTGNRISGSSSTTVTVTQDPLSTTNPTVSSSGLGGGGGGGGGY